MSQNSIQADAVEELQELGLREYEAKCFVALTKIPSGTAREVSEQIDVPRTRVYEAARSLESRGLVEIQHSTPQQFRAIPVAEAVRLLDKQRRSRIETLEQSLQTLKQDSSEVDIEEPEVWSLADPVAIETRTEQLIERAEEEILLLLGDQQVLWDGLSKQLRQALERDLDVVVGTASDPLQSRLGSSLPEEVVYRSELQWLDGVEFSTVAVGRLLLVDGTALLASSLLQSSGETREQAVYGTGRSNGLVVVFRRLLSQELDLI